MDVWKRKFKNHILERGKYYYDEGLVGDVYMSEHGYEADVEGSQTYHVKIGVSTDKIQDMYCTCPHAEGGNNCKHMAAVLFKVEDELNTVKYCSLIESLSKEQLCEVVKKMIIRQPSLANILVKFADKDTMDDLNYRADIYNIFESHADEDGYVSYNHADNLFYELNEYLEDHVHLFFERHCLKDALELSFFIFEKLSEFDIDDSDGYVYMLCQSCFSVWKDTYELANDCEKEYIHQRFFSLSMNSTCEFILPEFIEEFLLYVCEDEMLLNQKLKSIDRIIENPEGKYYKVYRTMFETLHPVVFRIELMHRLNFDEKEIEAYMLKFHHVPEVRQLEIDKNVELGNLKGTVELLKESKLLALDNPIWLKNFCEQLIDIYECSMVRKEYKQELIFYVYHIENLDLNYVFKLREVCSKEEWKSYLEVILNHLETSQLKLKFLNKEQQYESLLNLIVDTNEVLYMDEYESVLKRYFPERVLEFYVNYLNDEVQFAQDRKKYRRLMGYLNKISNLKDGYVVACRLANEWRQTYCRRKAMMDELNQAGF